MRENTSDLTVVILLYDSGYVTVPIPVDNNLPTRPFREQASHRHTDSIRGLQLSYYCSAKLS